MNDTKVKSTRRMSAVSKPVRKMAANFIKPKTSLKTSSILDEPIPDSFNAPILSTDVSSVQPPAAVSKRSLRSRMSHFMSSINSLKNSTTGLDPSSPNLSRRLSVRKQDR